MEGGREGGRLQTVEVQQEGRTAERREEEEDRQIRLMKMEEEKKEGERNEKARVWAF